MGLKCRIKYKSELEITDKTLSKILSHKYLHVNKVFPELMLSEDYLCNKDIPFLEGMQYVFYHTNQDTARAEIEEIITMIKKYDSIYLILE